MVSPERRPCLERRNQYRPCGAARGDENNTDQNESVDRPKNLSPNPHTVADTGQVWLEGHGPASQKKEDRYHNSIHAAIPTRTVRFLRICASHPRDCCGVGEI